MIFVLIFKKSQRRVVKIGLALTTHHTLVGASGGLSGVDPSASHGLSLQAFGEKGGGEV